VTSEKQKLLDKLERKDKRRGGRGRPGADADIDWLGAHGLDALVEAELLRDTQGQARRGPCGAVNPRALDRILPSWEVQVLCNT